MKTSPDSAAAVGACSLLLALQLAGPLAVHAADAAAAGDGTATSAAPQASPSSTTSSGGSDQLSEIVVTGIRADLEKALDTKEFAPVVLDSIDSTQLGRFPDSDVADSLEHLPGITVTRTTGGEGQKISVRGLGPEYNIVTLDNRILASDDDGRDLAFDVLPAELITGADVLKSAQASAVEGSIGGTVNLHTASALDNPGFHADANAEQEILRVHHRHQREPHPRFRARRGGLGSQIAHRLAECLQSEHLRAHQLSVSPGWGHAAPWGRAAHRDALLHHLRLDLR
jgi:TonB-dependent receptor